MEIVDTVEIPAGLKAGEWVLNWRMDQEESNQIWQSVRAPAIPAEHHARRAMAEHAAGAGGAAPSRPDCARLTCMPHRVPRLSLPVARSAPT